MSERSRWHPASLVEWGLVSALFRVFALMPAGWAYAAGEGAGRLVYALDGRHRRITQENLARAFPGELTGQQVADLARAVFENLGRTAVDVARSDRLLRQGALERCRVEGMERLLAARGRGKGVLVITAHFGPWELLPLMAALRYEPIHVVARPMDNPWLNDLLTRMRERGGNRVILKREALPLILKVLRQGETVGILIDQHITEKDGVVVPFFGRPASTVSAPALLALRSGAAVLPVGILREGRGRFCIRIGEEVLVERTGDLKTDVVLNTARFTAALERFIRLQPDHWFWVHRRWKTPLPVDERLQSIKIEI
ncbi:MAG: lysophospholipid acyltransferase family protein [Candidatus Methylomirabilales bacterium]